MIRSTALGEACKPRARKAARNTREELASAAEQGRKAARGGKYRPAPYADPEKVKAYEDAYWAERRARSR